MSSNTRTVRIDLKHFDTVKLSCPQCEKLTELDLTCMEDSARGQPLTCDCGYSLSELIESRDCTRMSVKLFGAYLLSNSFGRQESGPVRIESLSYSGVSCRTVASHTLTRGDRVRIKIVLDDVSKTELIRSLEVTRVEENLIAGKFVEVAGDFDTALADYLISR